MTKTEYTKNTVESTYKSRDTEEWLDIHFNRPIGFWWAKLFNHFGVHPNTVTILSIILGVAAGLMFYYPDLLHNLIGVFLLVWANFYDSADGQLARMTGKKTRWGRMLDGFAGDLWFITIYVAICLRLFYQPIPLTNTQWGIWIFVIALFSGIVCHAHQCQLADYYRNIHLYFLKGQAGSELDSSKKQRELLENTPHKGNFWWRMFLSQYAKYTSNQERQTPRFQELFSYIKNERGGQVSQQFRHDFCAQSKPLMKYANFITFNCRAITLYIACLINLPWIYFLVEIVVFSAIAHYLNRRHETMSAEFLAKLKEGKY